MDGLACAYYNEIDPKAAAWLRELIRAGAIAPGYVDERSIEDVLPSELVEFTQCHFFAGIGGWSCALRLAGWPDDKPVWTGSCPCQPFSAAGKGGGFEDPRHLWPAWFHLIGLCRPAVLFGEQVAGAAGRTWFDVVSADLEARYYALGSADLCAAGVGAPQLRQRLYFGAYDTGRRWARYRKLADAHGRDARAEGLQRSGEHGQQPTNRILSELADAHGRECIGGSVACEGDDFYGPNTRWSESDRCFATDCKIVELGHPQRAGLEGHAGDGDGEDGRPVSPGSATAASGLGRVADDAQQRCGEGSSYTRGLSAGDRSQGLSAGCLPGRHVDGFWSDVEWLYCRDDKYRPTQPGIHPLASGVLGRVGLLRGYGNAIVPEVAQAFIEAYCEATGR